MDVCELMSQRHSTTKMTFQSFLGNNSGSLLNNSVTGYCRFWNFFIINEIASIVFCLSIRTIDGHNFRWWAFPSRISVYLYLFGRNRAVEVNGHGWNQPLHINRCKSSLWWYSIISVAFLINHCPQKFCKTFTKCTVLWNKSDMIIKISPWENFRKVFVNNF